MMINLHAILFAQGFWLNLYVLLFLRFNFNFIYILVNANKMHLIEKSCRGSKPEKKVCF